MNPNKQMSSTQLNVVINNLRFIARSAISFAAIQTDLKGGIQSGLRRPRFLNN